MSASVILSGLAPIEVQREGWRGTDLISKPTSKFRTLGWQLDVGSKSIFGTEDFGNRGRTKGDLLELLSKFKKVNASIYTTIDTYTTLVHQWGLEDNFIVFPYQAEEHCKKLPETSESISKLCKSVSNYYWNISQKYVNAWDGQRKFAHRASNTSSYRCYAAYQVVEKALRYQIRPVDQNRKVLQFDWSAAEWSLILQINGYESPDDAYAIFVENGFRDETKTIILAWVYGSQVSSLENRFKEAGFDPKMVGNIIGKVEKMYPRVCGWREVCMSNSEMDFNGWRIQLGNEPYKRPNYYAQTALQICKWDLISRFEKLGVGFLGCGDLHDQLFFDFDPISEKTHASAIMAEVRKPIMGIKLKANFKVGENWGVDKA